MRKEEITVEVVSCLVCEQFPEWAGFEIRPVALDGWDNTTFRLGGQMSVRLPSHDRYVPQIEKEHQWLPLLAAHLPVPIPRPVAKGRPGCGFPRPWSVYEWLDGEPAPIVGVTDHDRLADDLGGFLAGLQMVSTAGGPPPGPHSFNRGGPVSVWDEQTRKAIDGMDGEVDVDGAVGVWDVALAAEWTGPDVWVHGDLTSSNLLLRDDRLCGVIDFGCAAVGDPACDLTPAWTMFKDTSRERFVAALQLDEGTWARARGWALWKALIAVPRRASDDLGDVAVRFGWRWDPLGVIDQVITDFRSRAEPTLPPKADPTSNQHCPGSPATGPFCVPSRPWEAIRKGEPNAESARPATPRDVTDCVVVRCVDQNMGFPGMFTYGERTSGLRGFGV